MTKFIKLKEVLAHVPFSRSQLYAMIAEGKFPKQIHLGGSAAFWNRRGSRGLDSGTHRGLAQGGLIYEGKLLVQVVAPVLHHLRAGLQVLGAVIRRAGAVLGPLMVRELNVDVIRVVALLK